MRVHSMSVTYPPKIEGVRTGKITQTIRVNQKRPKAVGDLLRIFKWTGKPYRSPQEVLCWGRVTVAIDIKICSSGIEMFQQMGNIIGVAGWKWDHLDDLARLDGIDPPTGLALRDVLLAKNTIPPNGTVGQIIRWDWLGMVKPVQVRQRRII